MGLVVQCDTPGCVSRYDGGNGGDKPGPYRPRGYQYYEKTQIRKDARYLGWLFMDEKDYCPCCANNIHDNIYKEALMSIEVTSHILTGSPMEVLRVEALDEADGNSGHHHYRISGFDLEYNPDFRPVSDNVRGTHMEIHFHHGNPIPNGPCGVTIEALLAVCAHRLEGFQKGPYAHEKNAQALDGIYGALDALKSRELSYLKPQEPASAESQPLFLEAGPFQKGALTHLVRWFDTFSEGTVTAINAGVFSDKVADAMERDIANHRYVLDNDKRDLLESVRVLRGHKLPNGYVFAAPAKITDTEVVAAVQYLRQNIHLFTQPTLYALSTGYVSDEAANLMLIDINASELNADLKSDLIAAVEKIRGKSVVSIQKVPALEEQPERVVKIEGINSAAMFNDFSIREVKPEEANIEIRVSTDARQSGSDLLVTRILSMLLEKGYSTITNVYQRLGELEGRPGFIGDEDGLKELYGEETGEKLIKALSNVNITVVQDLDASMRKTRQ